MIKVLRILNRTNIGGPVYNAIFLSKFLPAEFDTKLISGVTLAEEQNADSLIAQYGVEVHYVNEMKKSINPFQDYIAYKAIKKLIKEYKPDIVHTHAAKAGALGRLAAFHARVPIIIHTFHGNVFHSYFGKIVTNIFIKTEQFLAKRSTKIVAISESQKTELAEKFHICEAAKIAVIPNGIDLSGFIENQEAKRQAWRKKFNFNDDDMLIGIVGRIVPIKNHMMFADVVSQIYKELNNDKIHFVVIGDGDGREAIQKAFTERNISHHYFPEDTNSKSQVLFTSWQTEMDTVYAALDIVCLTSLNEGTPISLIEAQASAKAIVSTNVGGVKDTVLENESAFLTDTNDVASFAGSLKRLITDPELSSAMGKAGLAFVNKKYSHLRLVNDMAQLYKSLIAAQKFN